MQQRDHMQELIVYIARALVDEPDRVRVNKVSGAHSTIYELHVASDDMGRVIGKKGRIANAMRTLLRVAATREGKRAILEIV
jgi:hypothetical protein